MRNENLKIPYDINAEKSIISSVLLDPESLLKIINYIDPDDFYEPAYGAIFKIIVEFQSKSKSIDPIALKSYLGKKRKKRNLPNPDIIDEIITFIPITTNIEIYANIVKECSIRRKLISLSSDIIRLGLDEDLEINDVLNELEKKVFFLSNKSMLKKFVHIRDLLLDVAKKFDGVDRESFVGFSTGFVSLDKIIGGLHKGDLIIIAARPSVGKTSFMLEIARNAAVNLKKKVLIFSLEMSREQIADRLLSLQSEVSLMDIRLGNLTNEDWNKCYDAMNILHGTEIFIDDSPGQNINELKTKCRKWALDFEIDIIFVDYLQLLQGRNRDNRVQEVSEISQGLKNIARELKVPVVAISQLNRSVESRNDRRPQLSDLRESGAIEQDADMVIFLHREYYYNKDIDENAKDKSEAIVAKNRNGATGIANLRFIDKCAKFTSDDSFMDDNF